MNEINRLRSIRKNLALRSRILQGMRRFFEDEGFLEVCTPIRTPAPAPEPHIEAFRSEEAFLATSPELDMKRLLAAGYDRIYQITRAFRKGERGRMHLPEFTILEWYRASADYRVLMDDCQKLLHTLWTRLMPEDHDLHRAGRPLDVKGPWPRISVREAFLKWAGWDPLTDDNPQRFDEDLVDRIEKNLGFPTPCILKDYPSAFASLARLKPGNPLVAERFELYWAGIELANGFSELTDPQEQRARFVLAAHQRRKRSMAEYPLPEKFLESLASMPPAAGIALGVDRLVMIFCGAETLDEVTAFPPESLA